MAFSAATAKITQRYGTSKLPMFAAKMELKALERDFASNVHGKPSALFFDEGANKWVHTAGEQRRFSKDSDESFIEPHRLPKATSSADRYVEKLNRSLALKERLGRTAPMHQRQTIHGSPGSHHPAIPSLGVVTGEQGEFVDHIDIAPVAPSWGTKKTALPPPSAQARGLGIPKTRIDLPTDSLRRAERLDGRMEGAAILEGYAKAKELSKRRLPRPWKR